MPKPTKVLGIDIGLATTGWGVLESDGKKVRPVAWGVVLTGKEISLSERLQLLHEDVSSLIKEYVPKSAAVESLFYFKNQTTVMPVAQARGVVLLALQQGTIPTFEYTPLQVKSAVTGFGRADKKQVQAMVTKLLSLDAIPKPDDAADALAIAWLHIHSSGLKLK